VTVLPPPRRTSMSNWRSRRAEHHTFRTRAGRDPLSPESRDDQPADDESPDQPKTPKPDWTRPKSCPRFTSKQPGDVAITVFRLTCTEQVSDLLEPPDILRRMGCPIHRRSFEVRPPRRVDVLRISLFRPFPKTMGCLAFGPDGRLSAVHNGKPVVPSQHRQSFKRRGNATPGEPHECGDPGPQQLWAFGPSLQQRGRCHQTSTKALVMPLDDYLRRETHRESSDESWRAPALLPELAAPLLDEAIATRSPIGAHRSEHHWHPPKRAPEPYLRETG
jgi:hypothetical protein